MSQITRQCNTCGEAYTDCKSRVGKYCSRECFEKRDFGKLSICSVCATHFKRPKSRSHKYCSRECYDLYRTERITKHCKNCKQEFSDLRSRMEGKRSKEFCSQKCHGEANRGENNPTYKGGHLNTQGYVVISNNGKQIKRCRHTMEQQLGRKLESHEQVHHKNGDRADDNIENLELWSISHPKGQKIVDKISWATDFLSSYGYAFNSVGR